MLMILFKIVAGILIIVILLAFLLIDFIHDYCRKHVDKLEDKQVEIE